MAPPPPVPQATLDHMAPTTYGRRMTKASIEEVLKLQSGNAGSLDGIPVFQSPISSPPQPTVPSPTPLKASPLPSAAKKPAPPLKPEPYEFSYGPVLC